MQLSKEETLKKCADRLLVLAPAVTADDKKEACTTLGLNYWTVLRYLKGNVLNADTGTKLLEFLSNRINIRNAVLA